ncbi:MAG: diguanylate cyclase [Candidatus Omnitrophota bacterium]
MTAQRILVADKDSAVRMLVSTRLSVRGYTVVEAETSEACLTALERDPYQLALISDEMERLGHKTLIEKIRTKSNLYNLPIILMTEESKIAELVMSRERGFDDFLNKPFDPLALQLRISLNISRAKQRIEANALTHLPGNHAIENVIRQKIDRGEKFSVLYLDINHFKSFNDRYGFEKGDDVIRQTANILLQVRATLGIEEASFVGHVGGDDFVVILAPDKEEEYAQAFLAEFDRLMPTYYSEQDRKRGGVHVTNRQGKPQTFPVMSCSVAACNNLHRPYQNLGEIARDAAELKSFLKCQPGSHYLRDRRSSPIRKLEDAMQVLAPSMKKEVAVKKAAADVDPLGQVLMNAGLISQEQLSVALKKHLSTGQRLGQVLIKMNAVRSEQVGKMLERKLNVPYVSLKSFIVSREMLRYFTPEFIKTRRVVPLMIQDGRLSLAMCDPFDLHTLDAIEQITGMKPVPSLALEDEFEEFLEKAVDHLSESAAVNF